MFAGGSLGAAELQVGDEVPEVSRRRCPRAWLACVSGRPTEARAVERRPAT